MKNPVLKESKDGLTPDIVDGVVESDGNETPSVLHAPSRKGVWRFAGSVIDDRGSTEDGAAQTITAPSDADAESAVEAHLSAPVPVPAPESASEPVEAAPHMEPEPDVDHTAVIEIPSPAEAARDSVTTVTSYDFTPRPDLLLPAREANPFSLEVSWLDRLGAPALALGVGMGIIAIVLAWIMWPGASDQESSSIAVLGNKAQVEAVVRPLPLPRVEAPPPGVTPPLIEPVTPTAVPVPPATPAPPLVTLQPRELKPVEPIVERAAPESVVPSKAPARVQRVRKTAAKTAPKAARISAKPVQKPKRASAKAVAPTRSPVKSTAAPIVVPAPVSAQAALLKACRAYGYHAQLCIERGCKLTKFGLACTGK